MDPLKNIHFYYIRRENGQPIATVCFGLGRDDTKYTWSRGIAICSDKDRFDKKAGKSVAVGRARRANGTYSNSKPVAEPLYGKNGTRPVACEFIQCARRYGLQDVQFKSEFNVTLTDFEKNMLEKGEEA